MKERMNSNRDRILELFEKNESLALGDITQKLRISPQEGTELVLAMYREGLLIKESNPPKYKINKTKAAEG
ncbi:MAG: hypothetical protein R6U66_09190 [Bacteroidales bacterium]|jgi:Mn-dependent DtxR family transcriptional regulator